MRTVKIHPVRLNRWRNYWLKWPRQKQILASVLLWASRADAVRIEFNPDKNRDLVYRDESGEVISTELGPEPPEVAEWLHDYLHEIASDESWFGWKRPVKIVKLPTSIKFSIPDIEQKKTWRWLMEIDARTVTFTAK
jgi:hypothetical protein